MNSRQKDFKEQHKMIKGLSVEVRNNDVNKALKIFKKKVMEDGLLNNIRDREHFVSKGKKRRLAQAAGRRRWLKRVEETTIKRQRLY